MDLADTQRRREKGGRKRGGRTHRKVPKKTNSPHIKLCDSAALCEKKVLLSDEYRVTSSYSKPTISRDNN